ncbi:MAG TPA: UDP-N-acetylmuramate dehydrogenase [Candidatus Paceibacterota bacterium]
MMPKEQILFAGLTTLRVGGPIHDLFECTSENEVLNAITFAQAKHLPWRVLGEGSNVLASDEGFEGVVILMRIPGMTFTEEESFSLVTAGAGVHWDTLVEECAQRGLWGLENLAGIPGTVGASPVQNIGAYGSEVKDTIHSVRVLNTRSNAIEDMDNASCGFGYRDSLLKRDSALIILSVTFKLSRNSAPSLSYKDLAARASEGEDLSTPAKIAAAVRSIRAQKFPDLHEYGTAGSFFKNPTISTEAYEKLASEYKGLPGFPNAEGVKIPLAFVLDKILNLRGYREGNVSLFERQPLVLVADHGATQEEIDAFANEIAQRVFDATNITTEREVRTFP